MATLDGAARARTRPPVAVRADARRPGRGGPDGRRRRPPADVGRGAALARRSRGPSRTRIAPRRSTTTRSSSSRRPAGAATRSRTGPARATRAATTSRTGSDGRTRRSGPAPTPSMVRRGAGTRPGSTATSPPWRPATAARRRRRRAARRMSTRPRRPPRRAILGLRLDTGLPLAAASEPPLERVVRLGARGRAGLGHR